MTFAPALALVAALASSGPMGAPTASAPRVPWGNGQSNPEDLEVSLVTFGPGDDITEWFGHSALVVEDKARHLGRLYNYGEFSFDGNTVARYVLQALTFHVGERAVESTYERYAGHNRSVHIAVLKLTPEERQKIALYLATNALPENADYVYDHYLKNCATRPRDIIDDAVGGLLQKRGDKPARMTLRGHSRRMLAQNPFIEAAVDFLENDSVDRPIKVWDEAFLPAELERQVRDAGLIESERVFFEAKRDPIRQEPPFYLPFMLIAGVACGAVPVLVRRRRAALLAVTALFAALLGLAGTALLVGWLVTPHEVMHRNVNLFVADPLLLVVAALSLVAVRRPSLFVLVGRAWLGVEALAVVGAAVAAVAGQDVWQTYALCFPVIAGCAVAFIVHTRPASTQT